MRDFPLLLIALLVLGPCGDAHAELVSTLFSWDGGDSERFPEIWPGEGVYEIPTDSLITVGLPVHPENGDFVISSVTHTDGEELVSDSFWFLDTDHPDLAGRDGLVIQCSFIYLNTTYRPMWVLYDGPDDHAGWEVELPAQMEHWAHFKSPLESFTIPEGTDWQWVSIMGDYGWLPAGYVLFDNFLIRIYDAAGVVVEEMSVGRLKASY